ncbi:hypothetical protein [Neptuniibacter sp. 2_MG-2023]|uniref:hypothetical protein n=1 Tax=Neptuniibacter sp. 2_MG-2023 TaxID=3062671 RepID=UPI0026E2431B|nr:hypothetical protein [Neptuniibacter sp. 2_MG-2023]MDO6515534.1 hypothetical protein [Neptuniibacter sp. 2_MG-2023]
MTYWRRSYLSTFVFFYALSISLFLQLVFLPLVSSLHAGDGLLLGGDYSSFHRAAVFMAERLDSLGFFASFTFHPDGQGPVSILALHYWVTGIYKPWVFLPFNAFLFSVSVTALHFVLSQVVTKKIAVMCIIPMVFLPSSIMIFGQIHKDVFSLAGLCLIFYLWAFINELIDISWRSFIIVLVISFSSGFLFWLVRPYLLKIFILSFFSYFLFLMFLSVLKFKGFRLRFNDFICFFVLIISFISWDFLPVNSNKGLSSFANYVSFDDGYFDSLENNGFDSSIAGEVLLKINKTRNGFLNYKDAGSNIDTDINFTSWLELISYIPRSLQIGFFSPFPSMWFSEGRSPGGDLMRVISAFEMMYFYFSLFGLFLVIWLCDRGKKVLVCSLIICGMIIFIYSLVITNVGTLYRMRIGALHIMSSFGLCGWYYFYKLKVYRCFYTRNGS